MNRRALLTAWVIVAVAPLAGTAVADNDYTWTGAATLYAEFFDTQANWNPLPPNDPYVFGSDGAIDNTIFTGDAASLPRNTANLGGFDHDINELRFLSVTGGGFTIYDSIGSGWIDIKRIVQDSGENVVSAKLNAAETGYLGGQITGGVLSIPNAGNSLSGGAWDLSGNATLKVGGGDGNPSIGDTTFTANGATIELGDPTYPFEGVFRLETDGDPGLYAGGLAGAFNTTDPNPQDFNADGATGGIDPLGPSMSELTAKPPWQDDWTIVYTGQIYVPDNGADRTDGIGMVSFFENIDDNVSLVVEGTTLLNDTVWDTPTANTIQLSAGWHDFELRMGNGTGGAGIVGPLGFGVDYTGKVDVISNPSYTPNAADFIHPQNGVAIPTAPASGTVDYNSDAVFQGTGNRLMVNVGTEALLNGLTVASGELLPVYGGGTVVFDQLDSELNPSPNSVSGATLRVEDGTTLRVLATSATETGLVGAEVVLDGGTLSVGALNTISDVATFVGGSVDGSYWTQNPDDAALGNGGYGPEQDGREAFSSGDNLTDYFLNSASGAYLGPPDQALLLTAPFDFPAGGGANGPDDTNPFASIGVTVGTDDNGVPGDNIIAVWEGTIHLDLDATLAFGTASDDGSGIFIRDDQGDWVTVVDNNAFQGITNSRRAGQIALGAGDHEVLMYFYEGGGGAGLYFDTGGDRVLLDPTQAFDGYRPVETLEYDYGNDIFAEAGLVSGLDLALVKYDTNTGTANAGITAHFGDLSHGDGATLRITGAGSGARLTTNSVALTGTLTIDNNIPYETGFVDDGGAAGRLVKAGSGDMLLADPTNSLSSGTVLEARAGRLVGMKGASGNSLGEAGIELAGGQVVFAAEAGETSPVAYANPITVASGTSTLTAGKGGMAGTADAPMTIELGDAATTLSIPGGATVNLQATDGYTLSVPGSVSGNLAGGTTLAAPQGTVELGGAVQASNVNLNGADLAAAGTVDAGTLSVSGGTSTLAQDVTATTVNVSGGTATVNGVLQADDINLTGGNLVTVGGGTAARISIGGAMDTAGNQFAVTESISGGGFTLALSGAPAFYVEGSDISQARTIHAAGGTLTATSDSVGGPLEMDIGTSGDPQYAGTYTPAPGLDPNGTYSVEGGGSDIWNAGDHFHYVYLPFIGDFDVNVQVKSVENTNGWAKAGIMARENLVYTSRHAMVAVTPGSGVTAQGRETTGEGNCFYTNSTSVTAPEWVRLVRTGDTFTYYFRELETDAWTQLRQEVFDEGFADSFYLGLGVTAHNNDELATGEFSFPSWLYPTSVDQGDSSLVIGESTTLSAAGIGEIVLADLTLTDGTLTLSSATKLNLNNLTSAPGTAIAGTTGSGIVVRGNLDVAGDEIGQLDVTGDFRMLDGSTYQVDLDGSQSDLVAITGRLNVAATPWEVMVTPQAAVRTGSFNLLTYTGALQGYIEPTVSLDPDSVYSDLIDVENTFVSIGSKAIVLDVTSMDMHLWNGIDTPWEQISSWDDGATPTADSAAVVAAGPETATVTTAGQTAHTLIIDGGSVDVQGGSLDVVNNTHVLETPGSQLVVSGGAMTSDVLNSAGTTTVESGGSLQVTSANITGGVTTVAGASSDLTVETDLHVGDAGSLSVAAGATLTAPTLTSTGTLGLEGGAAATLGQLTVNAGTMGVSGATLDVTGQLVAAGGTVGFSSGATLNAAQLTASGADITIAGSAATLTELNASDGLVTVDTGSSAAVEQLNVTGTGQVSAVAPVTVSNAMTCGSGRYEATVGTFQVAGNVDVGGAETVILGGETSVLTVPDGYMHEAKIGDGLAGSAVHSGDTWTVTGSGSDIWGQADGMYFVYREFDVDQALDISARAGVFGFSGGTNEWRKAGLMIRDSLDADSRNGAVIVAELDTNGINAQMRPSDNVATLGSTEGAGTRITHDTPVWLRLTYAGDGQTFNMYYSEDPQTLGWTPVGSNVMTDPMTGTFVAGLAVTAHNAGEQTTVDFDGLSEQLTSAGFHNLTGSGEVDGSFTVHGNLMPGSSVGTITVYGDVTMAATSAYIAEVQGASDSDLIDVRGTLAIEDGARLGLSWLPGADAASKFGGTYTLATYDSHTGQFTLDPAAGNIAAAYIQDVVQDDTGVVVTLSGLVDGDANIDAVVDVLDYVVVSNNFGVGDNWRRGDVNMDGVVDVLDYVVISNNFGSTPSAGAALGLSAGSLDAAAVPEPGTLALLLCGALGILALLHRRRPWLCGHKLDFRFRQPQRVK